MPLVCPPPLDKVAKAGGSSLKIWCGGVDGHARTIRTADNSHWLRIAGIKPGTHH